jgi:hypothetical protein
VSFEELTSRRDARIAEILAGAQTKRNELLSLVQLCKAQGGGRRQ